MYLIDSSCIFSGCVLDRLLMCCADALWVYSQTPPSLNIHEESVNTPTKYTRILRQTDKPKYVHTEIL
ncbi:MAG: hypothetical protein LUD00_11520 [Prevotellaceae bacterium]|nr:hypothetical protein [Prevotellaceae bacterium]